MALAGRISGREPRVDIVVESPGVHHVVTVVGCAHAESSPDAGDVENFADLARDVAANRALLLVVGAVDDAVEQSGRGVGIEFVNVSDFDAYPWGNLARVPVVVSELDIRQFDLKVEGSGPMIMAETSDVRTIELHRADGSLIGTLGELVLGRWQTGQIPRRRGQYAAQPIADEPTFLRSGDDYIEVAMTADIGVDDAHYLGAVEVGDEGAVDTTAFSPDQIRTQWQPLASLDGLAIEPVFRVRLGD